MPLYVGRSPTIGGVQRSATFSTILPRLWPPWIRRCASAASRSANSRSGGSLTSPAFTITGERIRLDIEPDEITLKLDASVPCGLAINELISNSLKHAHPDGRPGEIGIRVRVAEGQEIVFEVSDDGVGIPADLDVRTTGGMGMGIVLALVEKQLGGRLSVDRSRGTSVTIVVPIDNVAV